MNIARDRLLDALMRNNLLIFAQRVFREINPGRVFRVGWHHETIAYFAARATANGDIDRLIVNLPPRSAKSTLLSVALSAFVLGRDPTKRVIVVSYNQNLSNGFSCQTRQVMLAPWYRRLFPDTVIPNRAAGEQYFTKKGGLAYGHVDRWHADRQGRPPHHPRRPAEGRRRLFRDGAGRSPRVGDADAVYPPRREDQGIDHPRSAAPA